MRTNSVDVMVLRQEGVELLSGLSDPKVLEDVVAVLRSRYLEEIVDLGPDGHPISRGQLLRIMEEAHESIRMGNGISQDEMEHWIDSLQD